MKAGRLASYLLVYHHVVVEQDIPALDPPVRMRIKRAIETRLVEHPEHHAKPLAHTLQGLWSLRVGDWRVVFALRGTEVCCCGSATAERSPEACPAGAEKRFRRATFAA